MKSYENMTQAEYEAVEKKRLHTFLFKYDYGVIELLNGVLFLGFGALIMFLPVSTSPLAKALTVPIADFYGLNLMAFAMFLFGVFKLIALWKGSLKMRKWVGLAGCFMWAFVFVLLTERPYSFTGIYFITVMTGFSVWTYVRLVMMHNAHRLLDPRDRYGNT